MPTPILKMEIELTQNGVSGNAGQSRDDLQLNLPVKVNLPISSFQNLDEYGFVWSWQFISVPPGFIGTFLNPDRRYTYFTPTHRGSYLIQLTLYKKVQDSSVLFTSELQPASGRVRARGRIIAAIKTENLNLRLPAKQEASEFTDSSWDVEINEIGKALDEAALGEAVTSFLDLNDVPSSFEGEGNKYVIVNTEEDALEFVSGTVEAHDLAGETHNAATLAELNAKISDATLDSNTDSRPPNGLASGDLSSSYPNPTVAKIQGRDIATTAPNNLEVLTWSSSTSKWYPNTVTLTGTAGGDLGGNYPEPTVVAIEGYAVSAAQPSHLDALVWDEENVNWEPMAFSFTSLQDVPFSYSGEGGKIVIVNDEEDGLEFSAGMPPGGDAGGDLDGTYPNPTVVAIEGYAVSAAQPIHLDALVWDEEGVNWEPLAFSFINMQDTPSTYTSKQHALISVNEAETDVEFVADNPLDGYVPMWLEEQVTWVAVAPTFINMQDTPTVYAGKQHALVSVNEAETAVEFVADNPLDGYVPMWLEEQVTWVAVAPTFINMQDTPTVYAGAASKFVAVKSSADGLEFVDAPTSGDGDGYCLMFSDDTAFTEAGTTYVVKKTFRLLLDPAKTPDSWRILITLWRSGASDTAWCKVDIGGDYVEFSTTETSETVKQGGMNVLIALEAGLTPVTVNISLKLATGAGDYAHLQYTDIYAVYSS